jgi:NAD(P)-dependent dehydrogenase (short-subunit alcohol dehydrogenase family)
MLQDKVAVATGAARGIGRAIAVEMAANGADILTALLGNLIGGTGLFAVVAHGQVREEIETGA